MSAQINGKQRAILIVAGLILLLFTFDKAMSGNPDGWLQTFMFLAAVGCFVLSASSRSKPDAG